MGIMGGKGRPVSPEAARHTWWRVRRDVARARERRAKAALQRNNYAAPHAAEWLREAMGFFERAEAVRPAHNDDAVLRWNACARTLNRHPEMHASSEEPPATLAPEW